MRIISRATIVEFAANHAECRDELLLWLDRVKKADWGTPQDITSSFPNSRGIVNSRALFKIKGNNYRIIVQINWVAKIVYICFVGSHAEYDKINAEEVWNY